MNNQQMMSVVRRLYDEVYSSGNLKVCDELLDPNVRVHDAAIPDSKPGINTFKNQEKIYNKAFANKKAKIEDIFVSENKVVVRWSCKGKHEGELQGFPPTNRTFNITGISIYQFGNNGKISEIFQSWDRLNLLEQLDILQPAHVLNG